MIDTLIEQINKQAESLFTDLGFNKTIINNETVFEYKGSYYKLTFVKGLGGFVMELAVSLEEAQKNLYEDGDIYSISLGENDILNQLAIDIRKYILQE